MIRWEPNGDFLLDAAWHGFVLGELVFLIIHHRDDMMYHLYFIVHPFTPREHAHLGEAIKLDELQAAAEHFVPDLLQLAAIGEEASDA